VIFSSADLLNLCARTVERGIQLAVAENLDGSAGFANQAGGDQ